MIDSKYVEMCSRNMENKFEPKVGNEKVLIFDIDQCLYHVPELEYFENTNIKSAFLSLSKLTEQMVDGIFSTVDLYRMAFFKILDMHPSHFCKTYEDEHPPRFIEKDPLLIEILSNIKIRKFCFTNGTKNRASKILQHMELEDLFEAVICTDSIDTEFICKPQITAYQFVENYLGIESRRNVYFYDDSEKNINAAISFGWNGILVKKGDLKDHLKVHIE